MASRNLFGNSHVGDEVSAGKAAFDESRFEDATAHFRAALRRGGWTVEEELRIRCQLSETLEKRGLHVEQLEAVSRYERPGAFDRLTEAAQMLILIRLGRAHSYNSDQPRAIALFNQATQIARRLDDHAGLGNCYYGLGRSYTFYGEVRIARDHYVSALEHFRHTGDWYKIAEAYLMLGYMQAYDGDFQNALQSFKQSLAIVGDRAEHNLLGRAYMYLAITFDNLGHTDEAIATWGQCIERFRLAANLPMLAINLNNLAEKFINLGRWSEAEPLIRQALSELKDTAYTSHYGGALDTLASLYTLQGKLDQADELLKESLQVIHSEKHSEWLEVSTQFTIGRGLMIKGQPEKAKAAFARAVYICLRGGYPRYTFEAQLLLAEARLAMGEVAPARTDVEAVRVGLRETPSLSPWALMMRMYAKIHAAEGHTAAALQFLGQSSSVYLLRGHRYDLAVNHILRGQLLEQQGNLPAAIREVETAVAAFTDLGASLDQHRAHEYFDRLRAQDGARAAIASSATPQDPDHGATASLSTSNFASSIDGFIALRLVNAAVFHDLLLYEIVAIVQEQAASRGVMVIESITDEGVPKAGARLKVAAAVGVDEREQATILETLSLMAPADYRGNFVYPFSDNQKAKFLLHIIDPRASRYMESTINIEPLLSLFEQGLETLTLRSRNRRTQVFDPSRVLAQVEIPGFICASRAMSHVLEQIDKIRSSDVMVLITGESGTGKELIARAVHASSSRRFNTFIPFNCSAAPKDMIESQLFGYRKGAFTGAVAANEGVIRAAERGTLFLDEIGDLPLDLQPKLLRFLQEGEIHPIGENQPLKVDVRVVAATNAELERAVAEGRFREDLFHRLNVIRILVPPLRQRREEIPALSNYYLNLYQQESAKSEIRLSEEALDLLVVYDWPGNVRQLCNEVRRIVAYSDSHTVVTPDGLSPEIIKASREADLVSAISLKVAPQSPMTAEGTTLAEAVEELERRMIQEALRRSTGNIARAAKELGLSRKGLYLKMDRLNFND
jgi:hydrogenase-4 transcriptional activator